MVQIGFNLETFGIALGIIAVFAAIYLTRATTGRILGWLYTHAVGNPRAALVIAVVITLATYFVLTRAWMSILAGAVIAVVGYLLYHFRAQIIGGLGGLTWPAWAHLPTTRNGWLLLGAGVLVLGIIAAAAIWGVPTIGGGGKAPPLQNVTVTPTPTPPAPATTPIPSLESKEKQPTTPSFEYNLAGNGSVSALGPDGRPLYSVNVPSSGESKLYAEGAIKDSGKVTGTFIMYGCTGKCNYTEFADEKTKEFLRGLLNK